MCISRLCWKLETKNVIQVLTLPRFYISSLLHYRWEQKATPVISPSCKAALRCPPYVLKMFRVPDSFVSDCIWKTSLPEECSVKWSSVGGEAILLQNLKGEPKIFMRAKKGKSNRFAQLWWRNAMKNKAEQQQLFHSLRKQNKTKTKKHL